MRGISNGVFLTMILIPASACCTWYSHTIIKSKKSRGGDSETFKWGLGDSAFESDTACLLEPGTGFDDVTFLGCVDGCALFRLKGSSTIDRVCSEGGKEKATERADDDTK